MKNRIAVWVILAVALQCHGLASAQKMEAPKDREPGDRAVFNITINNKTEVMEENWTALTNEEMIGIQKFGGKEYEVVLSRSPDYQIRKLVCFGIRKQCTYAPGLQYVNFPLEIGKKWANEFSVSSENGTAVLKQERIVDRIEKIKVPAGEFETFKISFTGRVSGKDNKGLSYTGREDGANWVALASGKMITVKTEYKSSFGDRVTLELISASFK